MLSKIKLFFNGKPIFLNAPVLQPETLKYKQVSYLPPTDKRSNAAAFIQTKSHLPQWGLCVNKQWAINAQTSQRRYAGCLTHCAYAREEKLSDKVLRLSALNKIFENMCWFNRNDHVHCYIIAHIGPEFA